MRWIISLTLLRRKNDEQKAFLKENFIYHSSGDRCWHSKEGVEDSIPLSVITDGLGVYPSVTWSPTKEKYQSFDSELGRRITSGKADLCELSDIACKLGNAQMPSSGKQEYLEGVVNSVMFG